MLHSALQSPHASNDIIYFRSISFVFYFLISFFSFSKRMVFHHSFSNTKDEKKKTKHISPCIPFVLQFFRTFTLRLLCVFLFLLFFLTHLCSHHLNCMSFYIFRCLFAFRFCRWNCICSIRISICRFGDSVAFYTLDACV